MTKKFHSLLRALKKHIFIKIYFFSIFKKKMEENSQRPGVKIRDINFRHRNLTLMSYYLNSVLHDWGKELPRFENNFGHRDSKK